MKFLGACNNPKAALEHCLRMEKEVRRKENADNARASRERTKARMAELKKQMEESEK